MLSTFGALNGGLMGGHTSLTKSNLSGKQADRILDDLGVDPGRFQLVPERPIRDADHIYLLRHTLMNPWLLAGPGERNYVDLYRDYLVEVVEEVLAAGTWRDGGSA